MKRDVKPQGASLLIRHEVRPDALRKYESWLRGVIDVASGFPGHEGVFVYKPDHTTTQYEIAVRFSDASCAQQWLDSDVRKTMLDEIRPELLSADDVEIQPGIDYWFSTPSAPLRQPVRWKQWLLLSVVIWLLSIITAPLFELLFRQVPVPDVLALAVSITVNVGLVVYFVMPRVIRLTSPWIYRK